MTKLQMIAVRVAPALLFVAMVLPSTGGRKW
jgi:hypothetical protein